MSVPLHFSAATPAHGHITSASLVGATEVEATLVQGCWRLFFSHSRRFPKASFSVVEGDLGEFVQTQPSAHTVALEAPHVPSMSFSLGDIFGFRFQSLTVLSVASNPYPLPFPPHIAIPNTQFNFGDVEDSRGFAAMHNGSVRSNYSIVLKDVEGRSYFGLGSRYAPLDRRGRRWTAWNTDDFAHDCTSDAPYASFPFLLMVDADGSSCGLFLDETCRSIFDLCATDDSRVVISAEGPTFDVYFIPGPSPHDVILRFASLTGHAPFPPLWALGLHQCRWGYASAEEVLDVAKQYDARDLPLDALWLDIDYMNAYRTFTWNLARFPDPPAIISQLRDVGLHVVTIIDPGICAKEDIEAYQAIKAVDGFVKDPRGAEIHAEVWTHPAAFPDFFSPPVRDVWAGLCASALLSRGVSGLWCDMNEPATFGIDGACGGRGVGELRGKTLPGGAVHAAGPHQLVHNAYGGLMAEASRGGFAAAGLATRPFVLTRAGFCGVQRHAWVWTGDNKSSWADLETSIGQTLTLGLCGVPFAGADVGGFSGTSDGELFVRWLWVGAHLPFFRIHSSLESPPQEPWRFGTKFESFARAAIAHRYALLPYLYTLAHKAAAVGAPMVQPLFVKFPSDPVVRRMADEWLLGEDLLVAPQLRAATPVRAVYLPPSAGDEWVAWGKEGVDSRPWAVLATPLDTPPVYQRVGSAVPLTKGMSRAASARWDSLMWRVAIGERACGVRGEVVADDGDGGGIDAVNKVCTSSLEGTFDGCRLSLHLKEGGVREATDRKVWVQILGRGAPVSCSAPWGIRDGHVTFRIGSTVELEW